MTRLARVTDVLEVPESSHEGGILRLAQPYEDLRVGVRLLRFVSHAGANGIAPPDAAGIFGLADFHAAGDDFASLLLRPLCMDRREGNRDESGTDYENTAQGSHGASLRDVRLASRVLQ